MLTQLMPGFRELRAPLVTGILWLLSAWVLFGEAVPTSSEATGFIKRIYDLGELVGRPGVVAAMFFTAYMLGSILMVPATVMAEIAGWVREITSFSVELVSVRLEWSGPSGFGIRAVLTERVLGELRAHVARAPAVTRATADVHASVARATEVLWRLTDLVLHDLTQLTTRLHASNTELFEDHDRLAAEADLRVNTGLSIAVLSLALAIRVSPAWLTGLVLTTLLVWLGIRRVRQSNDVIVHALISQIIDTTVLSGENREFQLALEE